MSHTKPTAQDTLAWKTIDKEREWLKAQLGSFPENQIWKVNMDLIPTAAHALTHQTMANWKMAKVSWDAMIDSMVDETKPESSDAAEEVAKWKFDSLCPEEQP